MELNTLCNSGCGNIDACCVKTGYDRIHASHDSNVSVKSGSDGTRTPWWRLFWRKMKKKIYDCSSSAKVVHFSYDPYGYSQNFDQGTFWSNDFDDISRSFSARFAVPSRVFENIET